MNDIAIFATTRTAVGKFGGAVIKDLLDSNILPQAPFCRLGKSEEAADPVLCHASDKTACVTGGAWR